MIDIHSHILYGIDDGARTIEESIEIIRRMGELGYKKIIATPHYIENTEYVADNKKKKELLEEIKNRLDEENIFVEVYLGNEIFIDDDLLKRMVSKEIYTLNNTNYILLELPRLEKCGYALDLIYELTRRGVKVILAHPERYVAFQKDFKLIEKYLELGVLLQGNIDSLSGKYGPHAKKLFIKLMKKRMYFVLASDIHHANSKFFDVFEDLKKKVIRYSDNEYVDDLLINHPQMILDNEITED